MSETVAFVSYVFKIKGCCRQRLKPLILSLRGLLLAVGDSGILGIDPIPSEDKPSIADTDTFTLKMT